MKVLSFLAKRFVAGITLDSAIGAAKKFKEKNINATIDHLGEDVLNRAAANYATSVYIKILERIKKEKLNANISIKLTKIGLAIDKNFCFENFKKIAIAAKRLHLRLEVDMEGSANTEMTMHLYKKILKYNNDVIQAIQAYLYRAYSDADEIVRLKGSLRIVKGAYKENEIVAYQKKSDVDKNYRKILNSFLGKSKFIAIATHDDAIINFARKIIKKKRIPQKKYEFEMLYGIRPYFKEELAKKGCAVRCYIPYGEEWFPYYFRRLKERKENIFFLVKNLFKK